MPVQYDDSGSVYDSTLLSYDGAQSRVATGSGSGTESTVRQVIRVRNGDASGVGSETASKQRIVVRLSVSSESVYDSTSTTYDASISYDGDGGSSSESASSLKVAKRAVTNSGIGSATTQSLAIHPRVATGSGTDTTFGVVGLRIVLRTATSSGIGDSVSLGGKVVFRQAQGSGVGTDTSLWQKSFIFRPPTEDRFPWSDYRDSSAAHRLFARATPGHRARNIFRLTTGAYTNVDPLDPSLVDKVYLGAHEHFVTEQEKADLVAAGYTVT